MSLIGDELPQCKSRSMAAQKFSPVFGETISFLAAKGKAIGGRTSTEVRILRFLSTTLLPGRSD